MGVDIKKIIKEEVGDFDWIGYTPTPMDIDGLPMGEYQDHYLFYFYPAIDYQTYASKVLPKIIATWPDLTDKIKDNTIDHVEVYAHREKKLYGGQEILGGYVEYFDCTTEECYVEELSEEGDIPINGRKTFEI